MNLESWPDSDPYKCGMARAAADDERYGPRFQALMCVADFDGWLENLSTDQVRDIVRTIEKAIESPSPK